MATIPYCTVHDTGQQPQVPIPPHQSDMHTQPPASVQQCRKRSTLNDKLPRESRTTAHARRVAVRTAIVQQCAIQACSSQQTLPHKRTDKQSTCAVNNVLCSAMHVFAGEHPYPSTSTQQGNQQHTRFCRVAHTGALHKQLAWLLKPITATADPPTGVPGKASNSSSTVA
jgi:hypothetical protein